MALCSELLVCLLRSKREVLLNMGSSASKMPQNFPFECFEEIFGHFSGTELLTCTLVSPSWNKCIGSSRQNMAKILLYFPEVKSGDLFKIVSKSERKYAFLHLNGVYSEDLRDFLSLEIRWKRIFSTMDFKNVAEYFDFLRLIPASIQTLGLCGQILDGKFDAVKKFPDFWFP